MERVLTSRLLGYAAPGGKTTFMAQKMNNTGVIIALEPNGSRARSLSFNIMRCGVYNTSIFRLGGLQASKFEVKFDRVLLDAPYAAVKE
jgi:16S rRNA C967 or C1407 C5-methylase (RsmB/RsmF family)